ncbi:hypothetical protein [Nocardia caishijiensis]|uniref:Uncharacterized protein n=1 Tax=Nocardia caishijiensis TaxID=184756 RepID=A0ABQ6YK72_9NOCA|nr:hypothetical protein [Nocardia caishijiensis]KAF0846195.1 hypothetical protein FNL39_105106 [Nocardia caishijiensis]
MEFDKGGWRRAADLAAGVVLLAVVFFLGMTVTLMIGFIGAPGGQSSECAGRCRTHVDIGAWLMTITTFVGAFVVVTLMVRSWWQRRLVSVWPLRWILVMIVMTIVSFGIAIYGAA